MRGADPVLLPPGSDRTPWSLRAARRATASPRVDAPPTGSNARQGLGQAAQREPQQPSGTPAPPRGSGSAFRPGITADTPLAPLAEQSRRRTGEVVEEEGGSVQSWSAAAASVAVPGQPALLESVAPGLLTTAEAAAPAAGEELTSELAAVAGAGDGSFLHAAIVTAAPHGHMTRAEVEVQGWAEEQGQAEEQEGGEEQGQAEGSAVAAGPPAPAAAAAAAAEEVRKVDPAGEVGAADAASAGTSAAAADAGTQGRGRGGSDRLARGTGAAAHAARAKAGKNLRAQPAPRRPGAGLGPGVPGPLLGWLLQGQSPQGQGHPPPSQNACEEEGGNSQSAADTTEHERREGCGAKHVAAPDTAPEVGLTRRAGNQAPQETRRDTRSSTRAQGIVWGRPAMPRNGAPHTPWLPAGRAPQSAQGGRDTVVPARGATTARGRRGGARGVRGGRGAIVGGREALVRSGSWRERHDRPEREAAPANQGAEDSDNSNDGEEFIPSQSHASEEISLEEEGGTPRGPRRRGGTGVGQGGTSAPTEAAAAAADGSARGGAGISNVLSPAELAANDAIWQQAAASMGDITIPAEADPPPAPRTS
ncbi:unnamed protein product [Closterium sp. Naga37s-1]|nr:unnamed protein product [Closterium sp. Naga37s-1]